MGSAVKIPAIHLVTARQQLRKERKLHTYDAVQERAGVLFQKEQDAEKLADGGQLAYEKPRNLTDPELQELQRAVDPERARMTDDIQRMGNSPDEVTATANRITSAMPQVLRDESLQAENQGRASAVPVQAAPVDDGQGPPESAPVQGISTGAMGAPAPLAAPGAPESPDLSQAGQDLPTSAAGGGPGPMARAGKKIKEGYGAIRQKFNDYISHTAIGANVLQMRASAEYTKMLTQQVQAGYLDAQEERQRKKILDTVGANLLEDPVQMRSVVGADASVPTADWTAYRKQIRDRVKGAGGDAQTQTRADLMVTQYQMGQFNQYATQAANDLSSGDTANAAKNWRMAHQYLPNSHDLQFTQKDGKLYSVYTDEKGQPQAIHELTPEAMQSAIARMKDPVSFLQLSHEMNDKDQARVLEALKVQVSAAQATAAAAQASASNRRADAAMIEANKKATAQPAGALTEAEMMKALTDTANNNALMGGKPADLNDSVAKMSLMQQILRQQPTLPVGTAAEIVLKGWGDPQLVQKLQQSNLLPAQAKADGGRVFGSPLGPEAPRGDAGNPSVGPAADEVRRAALRDAQRTQPPPVAAPPPTLPRDTRGARQKAMDDYVESANRGR